MQQMLMGGAGFAQPRPRREGDLLRRSGLPVPLSVAAAAEGADRHGVRPNSRSGGGRSSTPMTKLASMSATRSIPARICSTAPRSSASWARSTTIRAAASTTTRRTSCCRLDYLQFIDFYHERIKAFHVKDAELNPTGKLGVYGGFEDWVDRAGRFRSPGDGEVDFTGIFSKLTQYDYRQLGGGRVGVLPQGSRAGGRRGRDLVARPHHPSRATRTSTTTPAAGVRRSREPAALGLDR